MKPLKVCNECGGAQIGWIGGFPHNEYKGVQFCVDCRLIINREHKTAKVRYDKKNLLYLAEYPNGKVQYFCPELEIVNVCTEPLMLEPNANKKAVKDARVKHSNLQFRTRDAELLIIRALYDSLKYIKADEERHELLVSFLKEHPWSQVYICAALDPNRVYRLKSAHLKQLHNPMLSTTPRSLFVVLTGLQFNKYQPMEGALEWWRVVQELQPEGRKIANMILNKKFCDFTRAQCNKAMKEAGIRILIPRKHDE